MTDPRRKGSGGRPGQRGRGKKSPAARIGRGPCPESTGTLGSSETVFRAIADVVEDAIFEIHPDLRVCFTNAHACKMFGRSRGALVGKKVGEIFPREQALRMTGGIRRVFASGEPLGAEGWATFPTGHVFLSTRLIPLQRDEGPVTSVLGIARDISDLKRAMNELRESEEKFRGMAEESPNMIFIYRYDSGRIVYANRRCEELMGYPLNELLGASFDFRRLIAPESQDVVRSSYRMHRDRREVAPYEYTLLTRQGRRIRAILNTRLITFQREKAIVGIVTDITLRQRLEERFSNVVRTTSDGFWISDGQLRILFANNALCGMTGYRQEEIIGKRVPELTGVTDRVEVERHRGAMLGPGVDVFCTALRRKDGSLLEVEASARFDSSEGLGYAFLRDISQRRLAEKLLQQAKDSLERQNIELRKLDVMKDSLLRDVSHELKTPVAKQAMQIELLRDALGEGVAAVEGILQPMEECVTRQQSLIRNLLDLSRLEAGGRKFVRRRFRLDLLIDRIVRDYRPSTRAGKIGIRFRRRPVSMVGDSEMLWHVFSNLLNNAVKFRRKNRPGRIEIAVAPKGRTVVVSIRDDGIGMTKTEVGHAFDKFYQASPAVEGSGVGLTICKGIVEDQGGSIAISSPGKGKGTSVRVTLPVA